MKDGKMVDRDGHEIGDHLIGSTPGKGTNFEVRQLKRIVRERDELKAA